MVTMAIMKTPETRRRSMAKIILVFHSFGNIHATLEFDIFERSSQS